ISGGVDFVVNSPARRLFSAVEMSMQAPFVDAATSIDPTNRPNTFISYYTWGSALGLGLDLTLRSRYHTSLDAYMRAMWRAYGKREIPYDLDDLESTLAEVTGDATFAHDFFARYVRGREVVDYGALLAHAGFTVRKARPGRPLLGASRIRYGQAGATLGDPTVRGTSLYAAGLDRGDLIASLDGRAIRSEAALDSVLDAHAPGDSLTIEYEQRGRRRSGTVVLAQDPSLEIVPYEEAGLELTAEMRRFREAWLGPQRAQPETGGERGGGTDSAGSARP
ncbi:MAG: PDZ domain-containing protein, partial [Gemmatimonadota bacterium]